MSNKYAYRRRVSGFHHYGTSKLSYSRVSHFGMEEKKQPKNIYILKLTKHKNKQVSLENKWTMMIAGNLMPNG